MIVTKLLFKNVDVLKDNNYKLKKRSGIGTTILPLAVAIAVSSSVSNGLLHSSNDEPSIPPAIVSTLTTDVGADDINSMNIILNDNDCSDTLFQMVCDKLREDGIIFQVTSNGVNIDQDNSTVITLDQQYSAGNATLIFAPYNNTRVGHSDSLAIAMQSAFDQNGFIMGDILCSQIGYKEVDAGEVNLAQPTDTEDAIDENADVSFVTISFGTHNVNPTWIAKSIENGLARQKYYLDHCDNHTDLIYRANSDNSLDEVSNYFGTDSVSLKTYNHMVGTSFRDSQAVINPDVSTIDAFNRNNIFDINGVKTKAY